MCKIKEIATVSNIHTLSMIQGCCQRASVPDQHKALSSGHWEEDRIAWLGALRPCVPFGVLAQLLPSERVWWEGSIVSKGPVVPRRL